MIRLYNTAARAKQELVPINPDRVTMYVCGPTVYGRAHIGNFRPAVVFDVLQRLLRHTYGPDKVIYARNITDIDDKIMDKARAEGVSIDVITERYETLYLEDAATLGVERPDLHPHATTSIPAMVAMIELLIAKGHAYAAEGHVLFDVASHGDYGSLSRRPLDEMIAGARVEVAPYKKNAADFVLWKPSSKDQAGWPSPWGRGRPGWHIECSAMIAESLGQTIDIHGGGIDLTFPHHENECAQSACAHDGAPLANIWMHNGFLNFGGAEKMSKSLGNVLSVGELVEAGWTGDELRLGLLSAQYRQPLLWDEALLGQMRGRLDKWLRKLGDVPKGVRPPPPAAVVEALSDDLNTPAALAAIAGIEQDREALLGALAFLGLPSLRPERSRSAADTRGGGADPDATRIDAMVAERVAARKAKNWAESDRIRDALVAEGVILEDGPAGTIWRRT
ncbi:cysteine--tRNA ligase [Sandarakinorhabdus limnophila]|jgi:cysteinyl-tRNA synthetase|uniref:cysteine--tRNA ligase n=1 Tax=Sandarakinorhabdus limnophila TaxID=210512 RepID=UPI0026EEA831|nr:cysteine--tRNA ligase [Sandarakinorhabdus limnophila]